jgi:hypothetical protein
LKPQLTRLLDTSKLSERKALAVCLALGFLVRMIPELLAFPLPIGFDTINYAYIMKAEVILPHWSAFFSTTWLLNAIIVPLYSLLQVDPFLLLKIVAPLLFGLNAAGIYWFARKNLGWKLSMSLAAAVFFTLQLASLRISWDLLRNTLGMGILLFTLAYAKEVGSKRGFALFTGLSLLCVFAHEYAAVTLLVAVLGLVVWKVMKTQINLQTKRLILGVSPALSIFLAGLYLKFNPIHYAISSNIIRAGDTVAANAGGVFFLVDYLHVQSSIDFYPNYGSLALSVGVLFAVLFIPYVYLVVKGFFRNDTLNLWTSLLLVGSFSALIIPFSALEYWHRWMFMLAYPFTFYAINGLNKLLNSRHSEDKTTSFSKLLSNKKASFALLLTFGLAACYLVTPVTMVYANTSIPAVFNTYLYFSTNPTVPYGDVNDVVGAVTWLNGNMGLLSCAVLQHAYLSWGQLYFDKSHTIITFEKDLNQAVQTAYEHGFKQIFLIWWNQPTSWYGVSVPKSFVSVKDFGRISIYTVGDVSIGGS